MNRGQHRSRPHRVVILNDVAALSSGADLKTRVQGRGTARPAGRAAKLGHRLHDILPAFQATSSIVWARGALAELEGASGARLVKARESATCHRGFFGIARHAEAERPATRKGSTADNRVIALSMTGRSQWPSAIGSGHAAGASTLDNYWKTSPEAGLPAVHPRIVRICLLLGAATGHDWRGHRPGHASRVGNRQLQRHGALILTPSGQRIEQSGARRRYSSTGWLLQECTVSRTSPSRQSAANLTRLESDRSAHLQNCPPHLRGPALNPGQRTPHPDSGSQSDSRTSGGTC